MNWIAPTVAAAAALSCVTVSAQPSMLPAQPDWLRMADPIGAYPTTLTTSASGLTLSNGLITREFTIIPGGGFGTTEYRLESGDGTSFFRGLVPEARIWLDGATSGPGIDVGGLTGQQEWLLYYPDNIPTLIGNPLALVMLNYSWGPIEPAYAYIPRWGVNATAWPPKGLHLAVTFGVNTTANSSASDMVELPGTRADCAAECLTGWHTCDNTTIAGQCTFLRANASALCEAWPACYAVTCNNDRSDCQARGSDSSVYAWSSFTSYVKPGAVCAYSDLRVTVHYEMYDGIPCLSKWVVVAMADGSTQPGPVVSQVSVEVLRVPWELRGRLHAESAYMPSLGERNSYEAAGFYPQDGANFTGMTDSRWNMWKYDANEKGPWGADGAWQYWYDSGVNETMLDATFPFGPGVNITRSNPLNASYSSNPLTTFRVYEILHEQDTLDRQGLARKKMLRIAAPSTSEDFGPWYMVGGSNSSIRAGVDMAAAVGFRSLHTQVSPFNMSEAYIAAVAADVAYAHSKGILVGFYVLLQNPPGLSGATEAIDPSNGQGLGVACFATDFHAAFRANITAFVQATGFDFVDTDGPYEAYPCASHSHEHHLGADDSQYAQWRDNAAWYRTLPNSSNPLSLLGAGITITCPDPYELVSGTVAQPIGYTDHWADEGDRWEWLQLGRVYAYDGTLWKTPTNGLMPYDLSRAGGMSSADDLQFYDTSLAVFMGLAGRNFQYGALYQNAASQAIVQKWMRWFNTYRDLFNADVIHLRKPTGRSWDGFMHAHPAAAPGQPKCLALLFNPSKTRPITITTALNAYYCGFPPGYTVNVTWSNGDEGQVQQDAGFGVAVSRTVQPNGYDWVLLA